MGHEAFDCYCYYTAEATARDDIGLLIRPPAAGHVREWRDARYERFRAETVGEITKALAWLEHHIGQVAEYLWQADRAAAPNLVDIVRHATAALTQLPFAYEWRHRLPDGHLIAFAVRGYWTTEPAAADAAPTSAPRRLPEGRRYYSGDTSQGPQPNNQ